MRYDLNLQNKFSDFVLGAFLKKKKFLDIVFMPKYIESPNKYFQNTRSISEQYWNLKILKYVSEVFFFMCNMGENPDKIYGKAHFLQNQNTI